MAGAYESPSSKVQANPGMLAGRVRYLPVKHAACHQGTPEHQLHLAHADASST